MTLPAGNQPFGMNQLTARGPIIKGRHRTQIRPTRYGIIYLILVFAMFIGSINYNNNLGFLLTFLLGSIAFVSIADTYKNIAGISIASAFARPAFAGEKAVFEIIISRDTAPRGHIGFAFEGQPADYHDLAANEDHRLQVFARTSSRGIFKPGPLCIHADYPLGLLRSRKRIDLNLEAIVYPKPLPGKVKLLAASDPDGEKLRTSGPGSDDFRGLKSYAPGDPLERISWRASSRGQGLFIKDFKGLHGSVALLDWHSLSASDPEHKLSLLCHMVLKACQNDRTYGLRLPGKIITPGRGRGHKLRCLKALALF